MGNLCTKSFYLPPTEVIIGHNSDEGLIFIIPYVLNPSLWDVFQENFDTMAPTLLFNIGNASDITNIDVGNAHKLLEYYVGTIENINGENIQGRHVIVFLFSPIRCGCKRHSKKLIIGRKLGDIKTFAY